jgi:hypothetical protein
MMSDKPSAPERVQAAYRQLFNVSTALNAASDELTKTIAELDAVLKYLNLGVPAWVQISGNVDENGNYWSRSIGYARIHNQWGIALGTSKGNEGRDECDDEEWLFNDAPRWMRIEGVGKIPELLEKLIQQANDTTEKIKKKTAEAKELSIAIKAAAEESKPTNKLTPPPGRLTLPPSWGEEGAKLPIPSPPGPLTPPPSPNKAGAKSPLSPPPSPARK